MADAPRPFLMTNAGLHAAESLFVAAHPRAIQYLEQAPIVVMWALPWAKHGTGSADTFARQWIAGWCEQGVPLKRLIRLAGFTAPMRALGANVLQPSHAPIFAFLARIPAAVLGRCIPSTAKAQRAWLRALNAWLDRWRRRVAPTEIGGYFQWCAEHFAEGGVDAQQAADLADFHAWRECRFNLSWGLKRALEEMQASHARLTLSRQIATLPVGADDPIDFGDHADIHDLQGYSITALRTPRQIADEGVAMRHCAATYIQDVFNGRCHLVSIQKNGKRVATAELGGPKDKARLWRLRQLRGPCNAAVGHTVSALAAFYSETLRSRP